MQLVLNKWFLPIVAMFITLSISTVRIYSYLDEVLKTYASSFRVEDTNHYVYWTFHSRELQQLINSLEEKRTELTKKEEDMGTWQARLENERNELLAVRTELETFRTTISTAVVQSDAEEAKNLKTLATTYSVMNPEVSVGILSEMDENTVVKILALMKSDTVGPIFESMAKFPKQEAAMRAKIARLSEKLRLYKAGSSR